MLKVLRLGHRPLRDKRITTHCGLVARAFGADEFVISGKRDKKVEQSIQKVIKDWGGDFKVSYRRNWKKIVQDWEGLAVHLTMYGLPFQPELKKLHSKDLLILIGGKKVPLGAYELSDLNLAITNQPHSEVAALAIFLDRLLEGKELQKEFKKAKLRIVPQASGKKVIKK